MNMPRGLPRGFEDKLASSESKSKEVSNRKTPLGGDGSAIVADFGRECKSEGPTTPALPA